MTKLYKLPDSDRWVDKKEYFDFMFGEEYMQSTDKGTLKEYFKKLK
jgi:hypothetical protein